MNFALSDEQELLREAARGDAGARRDGRGGARCARGRRAAGPVADGVRGRLARAADLRGARRRGPGAVRGDARDGRGRPRARRACRCSATSPPRRCWTAAADDDIEAVAAGEPRAAFVAGAAARRPRRRLDVASRRAATARARRAARRTRRPGCRTRPAPTCSSSSARRRRGDGRAEGAAVEPRRPLRRDARARPRDVRRRHPARLDVDPADAGRGVVPGPGAAGRRVAGRGRDVPGPLGRVRQGALHVRPRDRLLPGGQARARRGAAAAGERAARCCTTPAGRASPSPTSSRWRPAPRVGRRAARSTAAARTNISVHGGIGATWEHDAPLYFRRAQLSRRLLGGTGAASDRVAGEVLASPA